MRQNEPRNQGAQAGSLNVRISLPWGKARVNQERIRSIVALIIGLAVCTGCTFSWQGPQTRGAASVVVETSIPSPSASAPAADVEPESSSTPPADIEREIQTLEAQVSLLRGLGLTTKIPLRVVPPEDLRAEVIESCLAERPNTSLKPDTLALLGIPGSDADPESIDAILAADWADGLTSRYDDPSHTIDLVDPPAADPTWRLGYIASYLSALRSANLRGFESAGCCPTACASEGDAGLAVAALTVGDTRLAMEQWVRIYADQKEAAQFGSLIDPIEEMSLFRAPQFLNDTYNLLLTAGRAFVQGLYLSGGWPAVDQAYENPPGSTEQILHPERYPEDSPLPLQAPDLGAALGPGWEPRQTTTLGEWRMRQTLQVYLPADEAIEAAADWGGDVLMTYRNAGLDRELLILITRWDNLRQAQDFSLAFRKYGEARFGERRPTAHADTWTWDSGYTLLERASDQTLWIIAPDQVTADLARAAFEFPVPGR